MLTQALLVDDSRSVLDFMKRLIEADGLVQATAFLDPLQAIAADREPDFDIVLRAAFEGGATDFLPKRPQAMEMNFRLRNLIRLGFAVRKLNDRAADLANE